MDARERLVLPLDVPDLGAARALVGELAAEVGVFKVGLELFTAAGPDAVRMVHDAGAACFLDLKLHDIPHTVARAVEAAARLGVRYLTVHAAAGTGCLAAAAQAAGDVRLLAVTVLTSMAAADLREVGLAGEPDEAVRRLATLAVGAGISGLVCSPAECAALRRALGPDVLLVVPGVRPAGSDRGDQRRVATPGEAIRNGADLLVVGRPIRNAPDRVEATRSVLREIAEAR